MKILINELDKNNQRFTIDGITLHSSTYLRYKVNSNHIDFLNDKFNKNNIVYDIVMYLSSEFGTDYYIEQLIKTLEKFYSRDLTHAEIKSFIEAYNDYQNL